jgi:hypothetical protein
VTFEDPVTAPSEPLGTLATSLYSASLNSMGAFDRRVSLAGAEGQPSPATTGFCESSKATCVAP